MTDPARTFIFANPAACGGLSTKRRELLVRLASVAGATLLGPETGSAAEFLGLVRRTVSAGDRVIFAGGDGTLHDGLNALAGLGVTVGYIPFGTGNAAAYALGIMEPGPLNAVAGPDETRLRRLLTAPTIRTLDLLELTMPGGPPPVLGLFASGGFCAAVARDRKGKGLAGYVVPGFRNFAGGFRRWNFTVEVDGARVWDGRCTFVVITKSRFYGAGVMVAPGADLADGLLHVAVYDTGRAGLTALYTAGFFGRRPTPDRVAEGTRVALRSKDTPFPVQIDGEFAGETDQASFRILPGAMSCMTGPGEGS